MLVDAGAKLDVRDYGMNGNDAGGRLREHTWLPVDYADGLIRIGTQSAIIQPEAGALLRKLMIARGHAGTRRPDGRSRASAWLRSCVNPFRMTSPTPSSASPGRRPASRLDDTR